MSELFDNLISTYKSMNIAFPDLKPVTVAQWILESGRGESSLATMHLNFAGLKWREEMVGFAIPVQHEAHDGIDFYCKFASLREFVTGYWKFLTREPYEGWETRAEQGPNEFIGFIGPIFNPAGQTYVNQVLSLVNEATQRLNAAAAAPLVSPTPLVAGAPVAIVIDPGHGGSETIGGSSPNNATSPPSPSELEKNWTLDLAKRTKVALLAKALAAGKNVNVFLTRETDINKGLSARANVASAKDAKLFLSIHFNAFNGTVRGVETLISMVNVNQAEDRNLAQAVQEKVVEVMHQIDPATTDMPNYDRGVRPQSLGVLNDVALGNSTSFHPCRACLVEIEFMDTPGFANLVRFTPPSPDREANRQKIADALADALLSQA